MKKLIALIFCLIPLTAYADPVTSQYMPNRIMRSSTGGTVLDLTDKRAIANVAAGQTDANVITAVTGKIIRVTGVAFVTGGTATTLTFNSKPSGSGVAISPLFANGINGGLGLGFNPQGWFETVAGEGLTVTTGAGATTGIIVTYVTY